MFKSFTRTKFDFSYYIYFLLFLVIFALTFLNANYLNIPTLEEKLYSLQAIRNWHISNDNHFFIPSYNTKAFSEPFYYTHLFDLPSVIYYFIFIIFGQKLIYISIFNLFITLIGVFVLFNTLEHLIGIKYATISIAVILFNSNSFLLLNHLHWPITFLLYSYCYKLINFENNFTKKYILLLATSCLTSWFSAVSIFLMCSMFFFYNFRSATITYNKNSSVSNFILFVFSFILLIALKIYQNYLVLGLNTSLNELLFTISNRIIGIPDFNSLVHFFNSNNIVLWGAPRSTSSSDLFESLYIILNKFLNKYSLLFFLTSILLILLNAYKINPLSKYITNKVLLFKFLIFYIAIFGWNIFFPSHALGYINPFIFIVTNVAIIIFFIDLLNQFLLYKFKSFNLSTIFYEFIFSMSTLIFLSLYILTNFKRIDPVIFNDSQLIFSNQRFSKLDGLTIKTNMSSIYLGYFLPNSLIAGRCTPDSLSETNLKNCLNIFTKLDEKTKTQLDKSDVFIFSRNYLSGNMLWTSSEELIIFENILNEFYNYSFKISSQNSEVIIFSQNKLVLN